MCVGGGEAQGAQERRPLSGSQRPPELGVCADFFPTERSSLPPLALQVCCLNTLRTLWKFLHEKSDMSRRGMAPWLQETLDESVLPESDMSSPTQARAQLPLTVPQRP